MGGRWAAVKSSEHLTRGAHPVQRWEEGSAFAAMGSRDAAAKPRADSPTYVLVSFEHLGIIPLV